MMIISFFFVTKYILDSQPRYNRARDTNSNFFFVAQPSVVSLKKNSIYLSSINLNEFHYNILID